MSWPGFLTAILASITILSMFTSLEASGESSNPGGSDSSLLVMAATNSSPAMTSSSSVEEYINLSRSEGVPVVIYPANPQESRRVWEESEGRESNGSAYLSLMEQARMQYLEDLNYSSYILDEFVKKRIQGREAMTATMTLFELTTHTVDMVDLLEPPPEFREYHNNSLQALINLEGYLWNMVKFYETNRRRYAVQGHDNFNKSMSYYENWASLSRQLH